MLKVIVDGMGGDDAPVEIVKGCIEAVNSDAELAVVITGQKELIDAELAKYGYDASRVEVVDCREIITNNEAPTLAIRSKKDSSLVVAIDRLKSDDEVVGLVSAGSTGAVFAGALLKLGRIPGINRPALCPALPSLKGWVAMCDCGANLECKPINILQYAIMGTAYARLALGKQNPTVGLLNNGTEEHKGDELHQTCYKLLSKLEGINFIGNIEGRDIMYGTADVVVCDGFTGNIAIKTLEGTAKSVSKMLKEEIMASAKAKIGYKLFMGKAFENFKNRVDYTRYGGALFIGAKKIIVKSHGSSKSITICNSILKAADVHRTGLLKSIAQSLSEVDLNALTAEE